MLEFIGDNPMFTAGAGLLGIGTGLALARQGLVQGAYMLRRRMVTTLDIPSRDKSYYWVLQWISERASSRAQHLSVRTSFEQHDNGSVVTRFGFVPAPGRHWFQWRGTWVQVERTREKAVDISPGASTGQLETVTITALTRDRSIIVDMLEEAKQTALAEQEGKTVVYTSWGSEWRPFGFPRRRRPLSSVVLDEGVSDKIVNDVKEFMSNGKWYMDRGIPYRRGYLLYGPPGSGKSSFIAALAGEFEFNIFVINLSERGLSDDRLNYLLSIVPSRSIILLEDIDAAFTKSREKGDGIMHVTFSGLLNALDGISSSEGRTVFMTTNHIERLDPALLRPGRIDFLQKLDDASPYQIRKMFLRFYEDEDALANRFVEKLKGRPVSTAHLQGHFLLFKDDPKGAVEQIEQLTQDRRISQLEVAKE